MRDGTDDREDSIGTGAVSLGEDGGIGGGGDGVAVIMALSVQVEMAGVEVSMLMFHQ